MAASGGKLDLPTVCDYQVTVTGRDEPRSFHLDPQGSGHTEGPRQVWVVERRPEPH